MPKVELHVHLEGAAPFDAMAEIYRRNGCVELSTPEAVREFATHGDFASFLDRFRHFLTWLKTLDDYRFLAAATCRNLAAHNVRYAELTVSLGAARFFHGLDPQAVLAVIREGCEIAKSETGIETGILVDLIRNLGPEAGWDSVRFAAEHQDQGIVGINLGGDEANFPTEPYRELYAYAGEAGLGLTAHAGEAAGPESVWASIDRLGVSRIGHGTRAIEDPALVAALARRGILIEVCASSNVSTGVISHLSEHPVRRMVEAGCRVCLNTDDPTYFGLELSSEIADVAEIHGFDATDLAQMQRQAISGSFAHYDLKRRLADDLTRFLAAESSPHPASTPRPF